MLERHSHVHPAFRGALNAMSGRVPPMQQYRVCVEWRHLDGTNSGIERTIPAANREAAYLWGLEKLGARLGTVDVVER